MSLSLIIAKAAEIDEQMIALETEVGEAHLVIESIEERLPQLAKAGGDDYVRASDKRRHVRERVRSIDVAIRSLRLQRDRLSMVLAYATSVDDDDAVAQALSEI